MTTKLAEILYEAQHLHEHDGRPLAIYNPHKKPVDELPVIYGFNNGGSPGFYYAQLLTEDGWGIGSHICSSEGYMPADLGCLEGTSPGRHEGFRKHYPDGYRMEFVTSSAMAANAGLNAALAKGKERFDATAAADESAVCDPEVAA